MYVKSTVLQEGWYLGKEGKKMERGRRTLEHVDHGADLALFDDPRVLRVLDRVHGVHDLFHLDRLVVLHEVVLLDRLQDRLARPVQRAQ